MRTSKPSCFLGAVAVVVLVVLIAGPRCFMGCILRPCKAAKKMRATYLRHTLETDGVGWRIVSEVTEATTLKIVCSFSHCKSILTQVLNILNMNKRTILYSLFWFNKWIILRTWPAQHHPISLFFLREDHTLHIQWSIPFLPPCKLGLNKQQVSKQTNKI